jgi:pimeloyl-ACP methyl ester carboxylesterase
MDDRTDRTVDLGAQALVEVGNGMRLCYERVGDAAGQPLLLIAGLGQQLHTWPDGFCAALVERGFAVIRFDNRDTGRSTHMSYPPPNPVAMFAGRRQPGQYLIGDMAADAVGLLDALGIASAHIVGASMGGMIAQTVAARHPERVRSLVSIMSNTGARRSGRPAVSTYLRMGARPPKTREQAGERAVRFFRHIGSYGFPYDAVWVREAAERAWDRDSDTGGVGRQLAAIVASGDRTAELARITAPTVVVHGDRDRMVHPSGGRATAAAIRDARLETIAGMGHDLPAGAWTRLVEIIATNAERATTGRPRGSADAEIPA